MIASSFLGIQAYGEKDDGSIKPNGQTVKYEKLEKLSEKEMKENAVTFRKTYGMNTATDYIEKVVLDNEIDTELEILFGTPLMAEELKVYEDKVRVQEDADVIKSIIDGNPNDYAGLYYDSVLGNMVVQIVSNSVDLQQKVKSKVKHGDKVKFEKQKFSKTDIDNAKDKIVKNDTSGLVKSIIPDTYNNRIVIILNEYTEENRKHFDNLVGQNGLLEFSPDSSITSEIYSTTGSDETNYGDPFPYGVRISGNNGNGCTDGFFGTNQSDKLVMITAGHCDPTTSTQAWFQPKNSLFELKEGDWSYRTSGDTGADAGWVVITGEKGKAEIPYPNSTSDPNPNRTPLNGIYVSDVVGTSIYMRGATTGRVVSGTIQYTNVDIQMSSGGYTWLRKQILTTNMGTFGDSGAPVVTNYTYVSQKGGYTFKLAGILSGANTISGVPGIVNGTYMRYGPIWGVNSALNLKTLNAGCPCY